MFNFHRAIDDNNFKLVEEILQEIKQEAAETKAETDLLFLFGSKIYGNSYPLHYAAHHGYVEICKLLLDHGDDLERKEKHNHFTPLARAVRNGQEKTVEYLLNRGADLTVKIGYREETLLHIAAKDREINICKLLLKYGDRESVNAKNYNGCTPLHYSTYLGFKDISKILKDAGADFYLQDCSKKTPRMYEEEFQRRNDEFQKNREQYREIDTFGRFLPRI